MRECKGAKVSLRTITGPWDLALGRVGVFERRADRAQGEKMTRGSSGAWH